jgi:hypothetical protein
VGERNPEPLFPSGEAILRVEEEDPHAAGKVYAESYVS